MKKIVISLVCLMGWCVLASVGPNWEWKNPSPHGFSMYDHVTFQGNNYLVVETGTILRSAVLDSWTPVFHGFAEGLNLAHIASTGNSLVVSGSKGIVLTSSDGSQWSKIQLPTTEALNVIAHGNGVTLIASNNSTIWRSTNLTDWTAIGTGMGTGYISDIVWTGSFFLACTSENKVGKSVDGQTWTSSTVPGATVSLTYIEWYNNKAWAVSFPSEVFQSADGQSNWTSVANISPESLYAFGSYGGYLFAVPDDFTVRRSLDGTSWPTVVNLPTTMATNNMSYTGSDILILAERGMLASSPDGTNWSLVTTYPMEPGMVAIASDGYRMVAVGPKILIKDPAGIWMDTGTSFGSLYDVSYDPAFKVFVAVGASGMILKSQDGVNWIQEVSSTTQDLWKVASFYDVRIAVGDNGTVVFSDSNSPSWSSQSITSLTLSTVIYSPAVGWVVAGVAGFMANSTDGISWTPVVNPDFGYSFQSLAVNDRRIVASTCCNTFTSTDLVQWNSFTPSSTGGESRVYWDGDNFLFWGLNFPLHTSKDGITWQAHTAPEWNFVDDLWFDGKTYFAIGKRGVFLTAPSPTNIGEESILNLSIPDNDINGVSHTKIWGGLVTALKSVRVRIAHPFLNDLNITLKNTITGNEITLMDRPVIPAIGLGYSDNLDLIFADDAPSSVLSACFSAVPGMFGTVAPLDSLANFDPLIDPPEGPWEITVRDMGLIDSGTFIAWAIDVTESIALCSGETVSLCGNYQAPHNGTTWFEWKHDGVSLGSGISNVCLDFPSVISSDSGRYDCYMHTPGGTRLIHTAFLDVAPNVKTTFKVKALGLDSIVLSTTGRTCFATPQWLNTRTGETATTTTWILAPFTPTETTLFECTVSESGQTVMDTSLVLVDMGGNFDKNGDGCNTLEDLKMMCPSWRQAFTAQTGVDPDGNGIYDVRDFLYINLDHEGFCP